MWVGVLAQFCRSQGKRAIYAGASDRDFVPGEGGQIRYARDRWLYRRGLARVDAIVAQNERQRATCRETHGRDAVVIPSCYQPPVTRKIENEDIVLWVGTLHVNKRPELLLELAQRLPQRRFVMIGGPGASRELYESIRARAAGIANLEFKGFLPLAEVEPWFDRARVLVNTSLYEGMPNTFLQAWARGVPTTSTVDVGAPVNCVSSDIEQLSRNIEVLFEDPAAGRKCKDYFERSHSCARVLGDYASLFDRVAA